MSDVMRKVTLPSTVRSDVFAGGHTFVWPVQVDWPEVQLTSEQSWANAVARAYGHEPPYPDHSFFDVAVPISLIVALARQLPKEVVFPC